MVRYSFHTSTVFKDLSLLSIVFQIKDFQKVMEQKQDSLKSKDEEIEKFRMKVSELEAEIKEFGEKDNAVKAKIQSLVKERGGW